MWLLLLVVLALIGVNDQNARTLLIVPFGIALCGVIEQVRPVRRLATPHNRAFPGCDLDAKCCQTTNNDHNRPATKTPLTIEELTISLDQGLA